MIPEVIMIALIVGLVMGGRLSRLADAPIRRAWLIWVPAGFFAMGWALRLWTPLSGKSWVFGVMHLGGILALLILCSVNQKIPGIKMVMAGLVLNAIAIGFNGGFMPASKGAIAQVFGSEYLQRTLEQPHVRSSFIDVGTRLWWLCDIIPKKIGIPLFNGVYSVGDIAMTVGIFVTVIAIMIAPLGDERRISA